MQLVLGTAGAAIGGAVGGTVGAQIGWMVGSLLGSLLDPPKIEGPKRTDKKLQRSEYGSAIPLIWGTVRTAGNVIWQPDEMTEHKQTSGGKGSKPKQTTYTYSASWAVQLAAAKRFGEPAILGINKIWADGRLVCENGLPTDDFPFVVYYGTEDQLPDPTIEADKGVGNVPAYRGTAYVVFPDVMLTQFGDRIPSLEFELIASGSGTVERVFTFADPPEMQSYTGYTNILPGSYLDGNELVVCTYIEDAPKSHYYEQRYDSRTGVLLSTTQTADVTNPLGDLWTSTTWIPSSNSNLAVGKSRGTGHNIPGEHFWYKAGVKGVTVEPPTGETSGANAYFYAVANPPYVYGDWVYALANSDSLSNRVRVYKWALGDGGQPSGEADADFFDVTTYSAVYPSPAPGNPTAGSYIITFDEDGYLWVLGGGGASYLHELFKVDPSDMSLVEQWFLTNSVDLDGEGSNIGDPSGNLNARGFSVSRGMICVTGSGSGTAGTSAQLFTISSGSPQAFTWRDNEDFLTTNGGGGWADLGNGYFITHEGLFRIEAAETLGQVVEDISVLSGLSASQVDVTDLTDSVYGFRVASQMTAKNAIEPLRQSYFFDGAEIDDVMVFKHRNHASIVTIDDADLGACVLGSPRPPLLAITRTPDHELPQRVNFTYTDPDMNYQANTVYDERQTGASTADVNIDVPLVFSNDAARAIASMHVFTALIEREKGQIWTSRKFERLMPMDVITVQDRDWRIVAKRYRSQGVVEFDLLRTHPALYDQDETIGIPGGGSAAAGHGGSTSHVGLAGTALMLLDIPSLLQSDPPFGFRAAMCPSGNGNWTGAGLYKSYDDSNYTLIAETSISDAMGYTTSGSGAGSPFGSPSVNGTLAVGGILGVRLINPDVELVSCSDVEFAQGGNLFAVQRSDGFWNICQFQYATLIDQGTYELTNIVQHAVDTQSIGLHADGDAFVLLPAIAVDAPETDLNVAIYYKAVTFGATVGSAPSQLFTNTGENAASFYNTVAQNLPTFSCDFGSPSGTRAGMVPAPTLADCAAERILSVHGWIDNTGGGGGGGGPGTIQIKNEGVVVLDEVRTLNFVGTVVTALDSGGSPSDEAIVAIHGAIQTQENGASVDTNCTTLNFDAGLLATDDGYGVTKVVALANMSVVAVSYSATTTVDLTNYRNYARVVINVGVLTGNITLNLTNGTDGQVIIVRLKQDTVGGRTFAGGSNLRFSSSLPSPTLTTTANKIDRLAFEWFDGPGSPSGYADLVAINLGY